MSESNRSEPDLYALELVPGLSRASGRESLSQAVRLIVGLAFVIGGRASQRVADSLLERY